MSLFRRRGGEEGPSAVEYGAETSLVNPYAGDKLTETLEGLGIPRQEEESDWNYRQRAFPEIFPKVGFSSAVSLLMGCSVTELNQEEKMILGTLEDQPNAQQLETFAKGFPEDPAISRAEQGETE